MISHLHVVVGLRMRGVTPPQLHGVVPNCGQRQYYELLQEICKLWLCIMQQ